MYDTGIIVRSYKQGEPIQVDVDLTAGHKGYMEFRISSSGTTGDDIGKLNGILLRTVRNLLISLFSSVFIFYLIKNKN